MTTQTKNVSFCDLVNFQDPNHDFRDPWLQQQSQFNHKKNWASIEGSRMLPANLMQSAISRVREDRQKFEVEAISDILSQSSSNFIFSRENTPANFTFPKKKIKHRTAGSDLFDIESKGSEGKREVESCFDGLILNQHFIGLSELVFLEAVGRQKKVNAKLINSWRDCLFLEDKQEIYGKDARFSFSRVFPINELEKGFHEIYGSGKKRCLRIGQQSLLLNHMEKYLEKCSKDVTRIARKDYDIINDILKAAKLEELEQLPTCMKQVELFWKILATQWRYSGKLDMKNRLLESALINGKSNFVDLRKDNPITAYLLSNSNQKELKGDKYHV